MEEPGQLVVLIALMGALAAGCPPSAASADPLTTAGGHLTIGGDVSLTGSVGDEGWFNETEYGRSVLHMAILSLSVQLRAGDQIALLSEIRTENFDNPRAYALYLRLRPWKERSFDIQAGRIPPVFGAFGRRRYGVDNPLIGLPLAYQYLTTLRADAVPRNADDLLAVRGHGWNVTYPGTQYTAPGLPLISGLRWDTGVQVRVGSQPVEWSAAVTQGTLSNPRTEDNNDGKQVSTRIAWKPNAALVLGVSGAAGEYLSREVAQYLPPAVAQTTRRQRALGLDLEASRGYGILRFEAVWTDWDVPPVSAPFITERLRALGLSLEGRYKIAPGFYAAARLDHLGFGEIQGSEARLSWDAPVTRIETGLGYSPWRNLWLKAVYQHDWRDGGAVRSQSIGAAQMSFWF
jgi:hypothetical protein